MSVAEEAGQSDTADQKCVLGTDWSELGPGYRSRTKAPGKGRLFNLGNEGFLLARPLPVACRAEPAQGAVRLMEVQAKG